MNTALITHLTELIKDACARDSNMFGCGIWTHHILPMTQMVPELAKLHDADEEMVLIAVLLHDYAGIKDASMVGDHHLHGAALARSILTEAGYPDQRIVVIEEAIRDHRGSAPGARTTAEARCVADCDAIAHITRLARTTSATHTTQRCRCCLPADNNCKGHAADSRQTPQ